MRLQTMVFTAPGAFEDEPRLLARVCEAGADWIHVRKPGWDRLSVRDFLRSLDDATLRRVRLHSHYDVALEAGAGGIQWNAKGIRDCDDGLAAEIAASGISCSVSAHTVTEATRGSLTVNGVDFTPDYATLSPIFDSISKPGYLSPFDLHRIGPLIRGHRVVALGGVEPCRFRFLAEKGFYGAGLLGYIWQGDFEARIRDFESNLRSLRLPGRPAV